MNTLKKIVILGIGIIIGLVLNNYLSDTDADPCPEIGEVRTQERSVESKRDTVFADSNKVTRNRYRPEPKEKYYETVDSVQKTYMVYQDSLINNELKITVTDTLEYGLIKSKEIKYSLFVPLKIIDTITIREKETIIKTIAKPVPMGGLFAGLNVGTNFKGKYSIAPEVELITKKGYAYGYSYDLANGIHSACIKKKIK